MNSCIRYFTFKNFMAPFYGWGSTASRLEPLRGGSLLFTTKFPEIPVNPNGTKTLLANGIKTFFINGNLNFINGPTSPPLLIFYPSMNYLQKP